MKSSNEYHPYMILFGPLETDGRVLRCLSVLAEEKMDPILLSCKTDSNFLCSNIFCSINLKINPIGLVRYLKFLFYSLFYWIKYRDKISFFYLQDYYSIPFGLIVSFFSKKKIIYDAHELLMPRSRDKLSLRDLLFLWGERILSKRTFCIIEANEERERIVKSQYKKTMITSVLNISQFKPSMLDIASCMHRANVLVYQGVLMESRNLSFFIYAMNSLPEDYHLLLIGDGPSKNEYINLAKTLNLNHRVTFTGSISNSEMMDILGKCKIGIISYPFSDLNNIYCSPNKIFEYGYKYIPMVATAQPFLQKSLCEYHIGEIFDQQSVDSFVESVTKICTNYSSYLPGFNRFLNDYNWNNESNKLKAVLNKVNEK
jgi:glycosyltransferase involved in cell wall biosynthesis